MDELLNYLEYAKLLIYFSLGIMVITYIVYRIFNDKNWAKYIPGLIVISIGIFTLFTLGSSFSLFKGIKDMVIILISLGSGMMGLFFALILGVYNKPIEAKKNKEN